MSVSLVKGQKVALDKNLIKIVAGLGWDVNKVDGQPAFDLDASAFLLGDNGKVLNDKGLVYFGNLKSEDGSVIHTGDNLTGAGEGDDEQIKIDLSKVPADIKKIVFTINIYRAESKNQNFGQVSNAFIRIFNEETSEELTKYDLSEDFSTATAIIVAEIYRNNDEWKVNALGNGVVDGFTAICKEYGVNV